MRPTDTRTLQAAYVLTVGGVATWGFTSGSTVVIVGAILLTLPSSVVAMVGYYVAYGLLAQVPGANPPSGDLAAWFSVTATVLGILALTAAALVDVVLLRLVLRGRRHRVPVDDDSPPGTPAC